MTLFAKLSFLTFGQLLSRGELVQAAGQRASRLGDPRRRGRSHLRQRSDVAPVPRCRRTELRRPRHGVRVVCRVQQGALRIGSTKIGRQRFVHDSGQGGSRFELPFSLSRLLLRLSLAQRSHGRTLTLTHVILGAYIYIYIYIYVAC